MTTQLTAEQTAVTISGPDPQMANRQGAKPAKLAKSNKSEGGIWPKKMKAAAASPTPASDLEFSGRIEKINIKEITPGERQTTFTMSAKNGGSRSYAINAVDAELAAVVLAAFAGKRKVRIATAPGDGGQARIVEIEARK